MCRLTAFCPGTERKEAIKILQEMEALNLDGYGEAYVKNGAFVVNKYPCSLSRLLKEKKTVLNHLPYNGWTICHMRKKTHGDKSYENCHPFVFGNYATVHNGIFDSKILKLGLSKFIKFTGETDSEIAAGLINIIGPKTFAEEISYSGAFLCLNIDGHLEIAKTSSVTDLAMHITEDNRFLISSELDKKKYKQMEFFEGFYKFDKDGRYVEHKKKEFSIWSASRNEEDYSVLRKYTEINWRRDRKCLNLIGERKIGNTRCWINGAWDDY